MIQLCDARGTEEAIQGLRGTFALTVNTLANGSLQQRPGPWKKIEDQVLVP